MTRIPRLLADNEAYATGHTGVADSHPRRGLAIVTCMDARIDVFAALGLQLGDATSYATPPVGSPTTSSAAWPCRSGCSASTPSSSCSTPVAGSPASPDDDLRALVGADLEFFSIDDHAAALEKDVALVRAQHYLGGLSHVAGFLFDVGSGAIDEIVRWERAS